MPARGPGTYLAVMSTSSFPEGETVNLGQMAVSGGRPLTPEVVLTEGAATVSPDVVINVAFHNDDLVRNAVKANLKKRTAASQSIATRAKAAFASFEPSRHAIADRAKASYLSPGDDPVLAMKTTMAEHLTAMRESSVGGKLRLAMTDKLKRMLDQTPGGLTMTTVDLGILLNHIDLKHTGGFKYKSPSALTICEAEIEAKRRLAQIQSSGATPAAPDSRNAVASVNPVPGTVDEDGDARAASLVDAEVGRQMATATSPESTLRFSVPQRSDSDDRKRALDTFELRDGPSDVTSYHDFSSLQIAFPHVWTELFDGQLKLLGTEIYTWWVRLKAFAGADDPGEDKPVGTLDDLRRLLRDVRELSGLVDNDSPKGFTGSTGSGGWLGLGWTLKDIVLNQAKKKEEAEKPAIEDDVLGDKSRLQQLLLKMDALMNERYAFHVFAENTINFGFLATYRQTWEPQSYQVGELVSTIPLAPKEIRRYTARKVAKKTRAVKELEDNLQTRRSESSDTSRVEREIVEKAQQKNNFNVTAHESFGGDGFQIDSTQSFGGEQAKESARAKKEFRENVMKSAQEYKQQHRMEVETTESSETEETTFHEIQNPNDELTVTYAFYELQRRYRISERIHKLTPVILVANTVPAPHHIDDAWLTQHDWILRRVILDDSFRPALRYLTESFVGAETNIRLLQANAAAQKNIVESVRQQVQAQDRVLSAAEKAVNDAIREVAAGQKAQGMVDVVKGFFDPLGITKEANTGMVAAAEGAADYAKETRDRAERERARLVGQLEVAISALQTAIDKLSAAIREHYNKTAEIDRLRLHVKDNILYYMQSIWSHEPPDQRYFRMYNIDVPDLSVNTSGALVGFEQWSDVYAGLRGMGGLFATLPLPPVNIPMRKLVEVADLDNVLGYKGNYSIFALKENNYLTLHMMQDYLEVGDELVLRDPDESGDYTIDELQALATCLYRRNKTEYEKQEPKIKQMLLDRLTSPRKDYEDVVVPTASLYIEALVGTHPLLEDFKLIHRALDVKKVQAEVRHAELENIRLAARALRGKDEDPDIERKIVVEGAAPQWTLQPDEN